jgi:hypothetical protein
LITGTTIQTLLCTNAVLGNEFATSVSKTFTPPITFSNEYFYYVYPVNFGTPSFTVNGLPNNAWGSTGAGTLTSFSYCNNVCFPQCYYIAKSDQALNATFTISVA